MGIKGLSKLLGDEAPSAIKEGKIENFFGRIIALDASMCMYQFLIAVRQQGPDGPSMLMNDAGEVTSHLMGFLSRTIRMMQSGIKPVYVFDGKPPQMKSGELSSRKIKREEAEQALKNAEEAGDQELMDKFSKRVVHVTRQHNEESKKMLRLMGIPVVEAPSEAEAQCAVLCKAGKVFATGTEDMDALTFGSPVLLRYLTAAESRKLPILEFDLARVLEEMKLSMDQFIDLCILCGCDYCDSIKGIGPKKSLALIRQHKCLEEIFKNIDTEKYHIPDSLKDNYVQVRKLFTEPEVESDTSQQFKWGNIDEEGLKEFLCKDKGFNEERVQRAIDRLKKTKGKHTQGRLESFFGPVTVKRKKVPEKASKNKKKSRGGFNKRR